jgi:hypothetical protein
LGKGLILAVIVIVILSISILAYTGALSSFFEPKPAVDMNKKLLDELSADSISNTDWAVWSQIFKDSGGILTKMNTWEQFKESYKQFSSMYPFQLDQNARVVWFKCAMNQAIYYEY